MRYNDCDISVVWVDLDDTLIDFTANARKALILMYDRELSLRQLFSSGDEWAVHYEHHNLALWAQYNVGLIKRDFLKMERFRRPLTEAGMPDSEARLTSERFDTIYLDLLASQKRLVPGALELLRHLRSLEVTIGILSNGFREVQHRKITSAGLDPYIDIVVLSDDIGINKPDVRLFDYAMERSGDNDPSHHLMIGDNPLTDITGAVNAGWNAIWYHPVTSYPPSPCPEGATETDSLFHIPHIIG